MKKIILTLLAALACLGVKAQLMPDPDTTARHFLIVASIGNLQEISAGEMAAQKGLRADVRSFGKLMVMDHGSGQAKLIALAKAKGYRLPPEATGGIKPALQLKDAGNAFDRLYVHAMVAAHHMTVERFQDYATTGKDPEVKAFAQQMLPMLKQHLAEITAIEEKLKAAAN